MTRFFIAFIILCASCLSLWADVVLDSLQQELQHYDSLNNTKKVDLLLELSWAVRRSDAGQMLSVAEDALSISDSIEYLEGKANAYKNMGIAWNIKGQADSAVFYMNKALTEAESLGHQPLILRTLNNLGLIYQRLGNYEVALEYYQQSASLSEKLHDNLLGVTLMNIGYLQTKLEAYDKALEYYRRALNFAETNENSIRISSCLHNIGGVYRAKNQLEVALQYHQRARKIAQRNGDNLLVCKALNSIGRIFEMQQKPDKAQTFFKKARELALQTDDQETVLQSELEMARIFAQKGENKAAIEVAEKGLAAAQSTMTKVEEVAFLKLLASLEKERGNANIAYQYLQDYLQLSEELFNQEKIRRIHALETRHQIQKKEVEVAFLEAKSDRQDAIIRRQATEFSAVLIGTLLLAFIAVMLYRTNQMRKNQSDLLTKKVEERTYELQETNHKLQQSNQELEQFAYITSHDLKEPLRNISGFTRLLERKLNHQLDDESRTFLRYVMKNTRQMHRLIEDVLQFTQIGKQTAEYEAIDLNKVLMTIDQQLMPK